MYSGYASNIPCFLKLTPRPSKDIFDTAGQDDFSYVQADLHPAALCTPVQNSTKLTLFFTELFGTSTIELGMVSCVFMLSHCRAALRM